jgi:hypothetical protein
LKNETQDEDSYDADSEPLQAAPDSPQDASSAPWLHALRLSICCVMR